MYNLKYYYNINKMNDLEPMHKKLQLSLFCPNNNTTICNIFSDSSNAD